MKASPNTKFSHLLIAALLALAAAAFVTGCTAYTAANDENPGARSLGGGGGHGSGTPHAH